MLVLTLATVALVLYAVPTLFLPISKETYLVVDVVAQALSLYIAYLLLTNKRYTSNISAGVGTAVGYLLGVLALGVVVAYGSNLPKNDSKWFLLDGACMAIWALVALGEMSRLK